MDNPFSWDYLTTTPGPNEVFGPFAIVFLVVFGIGLITSIVVYSNGAKRVLRDPVLRRMARRWSGWAIAIFGTGLFFFAIRWLQINPLSFGMRIWLWLSWLAFLALVGYAVYDVRAHYASARQAYEEQRRKQQYLRPATASAATGGRAAGSGASGAVSRPTKRRRR